MPRWEVSLTALFHSVFWQGKTQIANEKNPKQIIFNQRSRAKYLPGSPGLKRES